MNGETTSLAMLHERLPPLHLMALAALAAPIFIALAAPPASAQAVRPCGNGPYEQQVGQATSGGAIVPLCIDTTPSPTEPPEESPRGHGSASGYTGDGTVRLPPGWRQSYGLFRNVAVATDANTGRTVYDFIISVGHETQDEAREGLRRQCLARTDLLWPEADCTGDGTLIQMPFVTVVYYPDDPYWGGQRARFEVYSGSRPGPQGAGPAASGGVDYCFQSGIASDRCGQPVRHLVNGKIVAEGRGRRR